MDNKTFYDFTLSSIDGQDTPLARFRGQVVLAVNVASECGLTPQYAGLEALYREFRTRGFVVAGFPANDFGAQEPGTNEQIAAFCTSKYDVTFPMFAKICVLGPSKHPLYRFLVESTGGAEVSWNFEKFLVGRDGLVQKRFAPTVKPDSAELRAAVEEALSR